MPAPVVHFLTKCVFKAKSEIEKITGFLTLYFHFKKKWLNTMIAQQLILYIPLAWHLGKYHMRSEASIAMEWKNTATLEDFYPEFLSWQDSRFKVQDSRGVYWHSSYIHSTWCNEITFPRKQTVERNKNTIEQQKYEMLFFFHLTALNCTNVLKSDCMMIIVIIIMIYYLQEVQ